MGEWLELLQGHEWWEWVPTFDPLGVLGLMAGVVGWILSNIKGKRIKELECDATAVGAKIETHERELRKVRPAITWLEHRHKEIWEEALKFSFAGGKIATGATAETQTTTSSGVSAEKPGPQDVGPGASSA